MRSITKGTLLGAVLAAALMAQGPIGRRAIGARPDAATIVQRQVARLTTLLSLTTNQAGQATTLFTNAQTAIAPLETTLGTNRESLQTAVKGNATSTIDQLASTIGVLTGQITALQSKADAGFYAILTAEQKAKFDELGGAGGPGFGRGPGGPPPGR